MKAKGDLEHHVIEDVAIALGKALAGWIKRVWRGLEMPSFQWMML